jgi:hypothetical protein
MVSLSTVYGLTIVLGTLAAIGSAFAGTKVYPIQTGGTLEMALAPAAAILPAVTAALKSATKPTEEPLNTETTPLEKPEEVKPPVENPEEVKTEVTSSVELPSQEEEPLPTESVGGKKVPSWFKRKH